jgi:hypothetical protein
MSQPWPIIDNEAVNLVISRTLLVCHEFAASGDSLHLGTQGIRSLARDIFFDLPIDILLRLTEAARGATRHFCIALGRNFDCYVALCAFDCVIFGHGSSLVIRGDGAVRQKN